MKKLLFFSIFSIFALGFLMPVLVRAETVQEALNRANNNLTEMRQRVNGLETALNKARSDYISDCYNSSLEDRSPCDSFARNLSSGLSTEYTHPNSLARKLADAAKAYRLANILYNEKHDYYSTETGHTRTLNQEYKSLIGVPDTPENQSRATAFADKIQTYNTGRDSSGAGGQQQQINTEVSGNNTATTVANGITPETCGIFEGSFIQCLKDFTAWIVYFIMVVLAAILAFAGFLLDQTIQYTIVHMADNMGGITSINIAWQTLRDFANMFFIFILLYVAIRTILQVGSVDAKRTLVQIIIVAILINFSIFITKVVIDFSNILTLGFYEAMKSNLPAATNGTLSKGIMGILNIQNVLDSTTELGNAAQVAAKITEWGQSLTGFLTTSVMAIILIFITAFSFFAAAFLLIFRYAVLIFLIILSPLAFATYILPATKDNYEKWLKALLGQATFPVIYMMLMYVSIIILKGPLQVTSLGTATTIGTLNDAIDPVIKFSIAIFFINFALIMATKYASQVGGGAEKFMKWGLGKIEGARNTTRRIGVTAAGAATLGVAGAGLRTTAGRVGSAMAKSEYWNKKALEGGVVGRSLAKTIVQTGKAGEKATFDARNIKAVGSVVGAGAKGGYTERLDAKAEAVIKSVEQYGGASKDTEGKIEKARAEIKTHRKNYYKELRAGNAPAAAEAMRKLRAASGAIAKAEKAKSKEKTEQQTAYMAWLGTTGSKANFLLRTPSSYKLATAKFLKKVGPASDEDSLKAKVADFKIQIDQAPDAAAVNKIFNKMKDIEIGKLDDEVFATDKQPTGVPVSPTGYYPIGKVIDNLKTSHLESLKGTLNTGQKEEIRQYIRTHSTTTSGLQALHIWLTTDPRGKNW